MKLYVDTSGKTVTVSRETEPKNDQNGQQKVEKGTGRLMWSTQVFVLDETGGEVITITTVGEKPSVKVGQPVTVSNLEALPWATNGRNGVAFRATELKTAGSVSAGSTSSSSSSSSSAAHGDSWKESQPIETRCRDAAGSWIPEPTTCRCRGKEMTRGRYGSYTCRPRSRLIHPVKEGVTRESKLVEDQSSVADLAR